MRRYWAAIQTYSSSSGEAVRALSGAGIPHYHPKYRETRFAGVRRVRSLFEGYAFVRVNKRNWRNVVRLDDVKRIFVSGDFVSVIDDEFIGALRNLEDRLGYVDVDRLVHDHPVVIFLPGDMVTGLYGLLKNVRGKFLEYDEDGYARVLLSILGGREWEAHVDAHELIAA